MIETGALDKALRALKLSGMLDTLERAGIRYVQVSLDDADMYSDHALEQDVTNLRQAAVSRALWHARISLHNDAAATADPLLKAVAERLTPASIDISFALADDIADSLGESISELYVQALAAGRFSAPTGRLSRPTAASTGQLGCR